MLSEAQRTLVKSPPELWTELSDPASLARHLSELGEIRITSSEPEKRIEWEGEAITGAVTLAASGWGTKVTLTAVREPQAVEPEPLAEEPIPEPKVVPESATEPNTLAEPELPTEPDALEREPDPATPPATESRRGFFARLFRRRQKLSASDVIEQDLVAGPEPEPVAELDAEPSVEATPEPVAEPEPEQPDLAAELAAAEELATDQTTAVLTAVLDRLGAAHHRPFSRA